MDACGFKVVRITTPFNGPHILSATVPYVLKSVDYDKGGPGVAYYDSTPTTTSGESYRKAGGDNNYQGIDIQSDLESIGYVTSGEWMIYTLEVQDAGTYFVSAEIASYGESVCHIERDGINVTGPISMPTTGGWDVWAWHNISTPITFTKGTHQIRFYFGTPVLINLRNLKFMFQER